MCRAAARGRPTCPSRRAHDAGTNPPQLNALRGTNPRVGADRRQRHRLQRDPQNCSTANPVRPPVPAAVHASTALTSCASGCGHGAEDRRGPDRHQAALPDRADLRRQLRRDPSGPGSGCWPPWSRWHGPTCRTSAASSRGAERDARAAGAAGERQNSGSYTYREPEPGRLHVELGALGRAAGAREHGGAVSIRSARHGGVGAAVEAALQGRAAGSRAPGVSWIRAQFHSEGPRSSPPTWHPAVAPTCTVTLRRGVRDLEGEPRSRSATSSVAGPGDFVVASPRAWRTGSRTPAAGQLRSVNIHAAPEYVTEWL